MKLEVDNIRQVANRRLEYPPFPLICDEVENRTNDRSGIYEGWINKKSKRKLNEFKVQNVYFKKMPQTMPMTIQSQKLIVRMYIETYTNMFLKVHPFVDPDSFYREMDTAFDSSPLLSAMCLRSHRYIQYRLRGQRPPPLQQDPLYTRTKALLFQNINSKSLQLIQAHLILSLEEVAYSCCLDGWKSVCIANSKAHDLGINQVITGPMKKHQENPEAEATWRMCLVQEVLICIYNLKPFFSKPELYLGSFENPTLGDPDECSPEEFSSKLYARNFYPKSSVQYQLMDFYLLLAKLLYLNDFLGTAAIHRIKDDRALENQIFKFLEQLKTYLPAFVTTEYLLSANSSNDPYFIVYFHTHIYRAYVVMIVCVSAINAIKSTTPLSPSIGKIQAILVSQAVDVAKIFANNKNGEWNSLLATDIFYATIAKLANGVLAMIPGSNRKMDILVCQETAETLVPLWSFGFGKLEYFTQKLITK